MKICKSISLFTALILLFSCMTIMPVTVSADTSTAIPKWDGTEDYSWYDDDETEFHLTTPEEFAGLATLVNRSKKTMKGKTIFLENDISLNNKAFLSIGNEYNPFAGSFDAKNHTIKDIYCKDTSYSSYTGLFGVSSGIIQNMIVDNTRIDISSNYYPSSVICNENKGGEIINCINYGSISIINPSRISSNISSVICGVNIGGRIASCINYGAISVELSPDSYEQNEQKDITTEYVYGLICGQNKEQGIITECKNYASVSCVINYSESGTTTSSTKIYHHEYSYFIGGVCGKTDSTITNCSNNGNILAKSCGNIKIKNPKNENGYIYNYHTLKTGGICGEGSADQCFNIGCIDVNANNGTGFVGGISAYGGTVSCSNCYNVGNCSLLNETGGSCSGIANHGSSINCYNMGTLYSSGNARCYGITASGKASNSYNAGAMTKTGYGICGSSSCTNCYYLNSTAANGGGNSIAKNDANMRKPEFAETLGDAFVYVENDYPKLAWETVRFNARFEENDILIRSYNEQKALNVTTTYSGPITYLSTDPSVATVDSEGVMTGLGEGTTQIYAICGEARAECTVTVKYNYQNYYFDPAELELKTGETESLSLISKATGKEADLSGVKYSSSDQNIATVSASGAVTAIAEGQCTIKASLLGGELTCTVNVVKPVETEPINLDPCLNISELTIKQGESSVISVENYNGNVTWISDNTVAATVKADSNPLSATISGVKKGTAKIYAMLSDGSTLTCNIIVSEPEQQVAVWGDTDCNDEVDVLDAVLLARVAVEDTGCGITDQGKINADVTHDSAVKTDDLTKLLKYLAGLLSADDLSKV